MGNTLRFVLLLCIAFPGFFGCAGELEQPAGLEESVKGEAPDPVRKIKPRPHRTLPPGLEKQFAQHIQAFMTETQADHTVFASELNIRLRAGEVLYVVDVRDQPSYQRGHIPSAINIPIELLFTEEMLEGFPDDGTPVVVVCANGHVASMAAGLLGSMGYNAYALRFGMIAWNRTTPVQVYSTTQTPQTITGLGGSIEQ